MVRTLGLINSRRSLLLGRAQHDAGRTDTLHSAGSVLDVTAIVALVGWTILELIVLWIIGLFGRDSASTTA